MKVLFVLAMIVAVCASSTSTGSHTLVWNFLGHWTSFGSNGGLAATAEAWNNWTIAGTSQSGTVDFSGEDTEGRIFQSRLSGSYSQASSPGVYEVLLSGQATDLSRNVVMTLAYNLSAYSSSNTQVSLLGSSAVSLDGTVIGQDYLEASLSPTFAQTQGIFSLFPTSSYPALINYGAFTGQPPQ